MEAQVEEALERESGGTRQMEIEMVGGRKCKLSDTISG